MSKGLEALEELKESCKTHMGTMVYILQEDKFETIEEELKEYQEIKTYMQQYEISEIEELRRVLHNDWVIRQKFKTDTAYISKALEIIKEKNVWFWVFRRTHNVNEYNEKVAMYYTPCDSLTEEEYNLLKEVLSYGK